MAVAAWLPLTARSGEDAVRILADARPDLFILAIDDSSDDDLTLIDQARADPNSEHVPIVCVLDRADRKQLTIEAFGRRADDVVPACRSSCSRCS
ncbi:MAG: hypothetical protein ABIP17_09470 [Ilumatobacteraceae bacterium]